VFTARYGLIYYIKQITFSLKSAEWTKVSNEKYVNKFDATFQTNTKLLTVRDSNGSKM
jgi:ribosomal protein S17E